MYKRLNRFLNNIDDVGKKLTALVKTYNTAVGSLEGRLLPGARRFKEIAEITDKEPSLQPLEVEPRPLNAPELKNEK